MVILQISSHDPLEDLQDSQIIHLLELLRNKLKEYGVEFNKNDTHITTISIGNESACKKTADILLREYGLYLQPVNYPTVKKGEACLRITTTLKHDDAEMIYLAQSLKKVLPSTANKPAAHQLKQHKNP